jgi:hypothetical protein
VEKKVEMIDSQISHFRITGELGQGGMGIVYRAIDEKLGREVALRSCCPIFSATRNGAIVFSRKLVPPPG